ncbi:unnamed protein product [Rhizoctonia solani]|uniref:Uncharacterized protein n=1 Tax=Rhizoctonia solani TaxID=456999 RepID=A0A8H3H8Q8_9AGAM|nr:unnamed protein product [Rhizoctonia solani]CAE6516516.1 unnamed protein product [Rhizoctonia solani]
MMASYSARIKGVLDIAPAINHELGRLLRLLQLTHKRIHETVPVQEPYWKWVGSMESVHHLVHALSNMEVVSKVYDAFTRNAFFREANGLHSKRVASEPSAYAPRQIATVQCIRGSSKITHAGLTIQTESLQSERMTGHSLRSASTQHPQGPQISPANSWQITQGTLTESPVDTHPYCCTHIPTYSLKWCTCFTHDL